MSSSIPPRSRSYSAKATRMSGCFATSGATRSKVIGMIDDILRAYAAGDTVAMIAARLPVSRETVRKEIVKAGMGRERRRARGIAFLAGVMTLPLARQTYGKTR